MMNFKTRKPSPEKGKPEFLGKQIPGHDYVTTHTFKSVRGDITLHIRGETDRSKALRLLADNSRPKEVSEELEKGLVQAIDVLRTTTPSFEPGSETGFDNNIVLLLGEYAKIGYPSALVRGAAQGALMVRRDTF